MLGIRLTSSLEAGRPTVLERLISEVLVMQISIMLLCTEHCSVPLDPGLCEAMVICEDRSAAP